jgi:hydrogenase nickel incorporation protein HypA/HybF
MHEMSIVQNLVEIIRDEMSTHGAKTLRSVRLQVGEMSAIVPDALSFCFEVITAGTEMEGARLVIDMVPLEGACPACGKRFRIQDFVFLCPDCGNSAVETISGRELSIVEIEVDEEDEVSSKQ